MIYLVGGSGYIGSHLARLLRKMDAPFKILDLKDPPAGENSAFERRDITAGGPIGKPGDVVVWLAGLPREPKGAEENERWRDAFWRVFAEAPLELVKADRLVFISSAQVVYRAGGDSLYAQVKAGAEGDLFYAFGHKLRIIRPGTVWGGFDRGLPVRTDTAINRHLVTGVPLTNNYRAYTCHIDIVVNQVTNAIFEKEGDYLASEVSSDLGKPTTTEILKKEESKRCRILLRMDLRAERAAAVGTPLDPGYRKWYEDYYGLPSE